MTETVQVPNPAAVRAANIETALAIGTIGAFLGALVGGAIKGGVGLAVGAAVGGLGAGGVTYAVVAQKPVPSSV